MNSAKPKHIGVLYTSGLDSTFLVYKNLKEGNVVQPFYVRLSNNDTKTKAELYNIDKQIELFREAYGESIKSIRTIMKLNIDEFSYTTALVQAPMWVYALQFVQNCDIDEFQIGYVMNDCAISYLDEIKILYRTFHGLAMMGSKQVPLAFPLTKYSKVDILTDLPGKYRRYLWSCEMPRVIGEDDHIEYHPCGGTCHPCTKYHNIEREFKRGFPESYPSLYGKIIDIEGYKERFICTDKPKLTIITNDAGIGVPTSWPDVDEPMRIA